MRLRKVSETNKYQLHTEHYGAWESDLRNISAKAHELGIPYEEMVKAVKEMDALGHNVAEFGVYNKTFMFTAKD